MKFQPNSHRWIHVMYREHTHIMTIWYIACTMHCAQWNTPDKLQEWSWLSSHCLRWDGAYSKRCTEMGLLMISKSIYWTLSKVLYTVNTQTRRNIFTSVTYTKHFTSIYHATKADKSFQPVMEFSWVCFLNSQIIFISINFVLVTSVIKRIYYSTCLTNW